MKKVLLGLCVVAAHFISAQSLISFESAEGYTVGNVDGQQGWTTTSTGAGSPNIANQTISTEDFVSGSQSLKITKEAAFPGQTNPIVGAFKQIGSSIPYNNFVLSFDIKITEQTANSSLYEFQTVGAGPTGGVYVIRLRFSESGAILAAQTVGTTSSFATTTGTWAPNTWYRVKIEGTANGLTYYLNGAQIFSGAFFQEYPFTEMRFVHDNYAGSAFIDRIAINNEASLSTVEIAEIANMVSIYPNPVTDVLHIKTKDRIKSAAIYDMSGKKINVRVKDSQIDVSALQNGNYIITVQTDKGEFSDKFIKK
ncbi:T9SS type A sorting domain-containing protein [Chryseobacterium sp. MFBS3-17]|uniref:T9SS type A sorting domain-containing protein n=1 Tax=Chryseobacterium sp. MFBS3-17 TaxID=2886689 RepID=UPI001D0F068B|nr:T9SS type A sorting domain-containing protein [Chryseobacterium sp. MFBS3-17]MCC2590138.1 T9SS type A sorting domain-containing protein [Chryseobacterium sp. MFBS3-17]